MSFTNLLATKAQSLSKNEATTCQNSEGACGRRWIDFWYSWRTEVGLRNTTDADNGNGGKTHRGIPTEITSSRRHQRIPVSKRIQICEEADT